MMDCRRCTDNLTAFLDGELNPSDSERIRQHVDSCPACAGELRALKEAADFVESHRGDLEPRPESWNLIRARISAEDSRSPARLFAFSRWGIAAAALAVCVMLGAGYLRYQQVQKRDLDSYIAQYLRERAARSVRAARNARGADTEIAIPYAHNPFTEIKSILTDNPFRSEDR
jgi:predicted anti-sigma-YlaC factor YlaD